MTNKYTVSKEYKEDSGKQNTGQAEINLDFKDQPEPKT